MKLRLEWFSITAAVLSLAQAPALVTSQYQTANSYSKQNSTNLLAQSQSNDPQYWLNQGKLLFDLEQDEALEAYDEVIGINPELAEGWYRRGRALFYLERYPEAITSSDRALRLEPNYFGAWNTRGVALYNSERYPEAITSYDKAIQINRNWGSLGPAITWYNQGDALISLERYPEAIASYDKALKIDPKFDLAYYNKACVYALQGKVDLAIENFQQVIKLDPGKLQELAKTDPDFDRIRQDERFQALLRENTN